MGLYTLMHAAAWQHEQLRNTDSYRVADEMKSATKAENNNIGVESSCRQIDGDPLLASADVKD